MGIRLEIMEKEIDNFIIGGKQKSFIEKLEEDFKKAIKKVKKNVNR